MEANALVWGGLALALVMFFSWALEVHRTLREILIETKRLREELEDRNRRP